MFFKKEKRVESQKSQRLKLSFLTEFSSESRTVSPNLTPQQHTTHMGLMTQVNFICFRSLHHPLLRDVDRGGDASASPGAWSRPEAKSWSCWRLETGELS